MIHTVKGFSIVNKPEIDVFLEHSCFFNDPADVGNLFSGFSTFSKSSLNIWKFMVHKLLKPSLKNFECYLTSRWNDCNCAVIWTFFGIALLWDWNKTVLFQSCGHCWAFQICLCIECSTFRASSFRIWNSSTGIPSPPLALSMLPQAHLTLLSRMSGSRWVITPSWLSVSWDLFCIVLRVFLPPFLNILVSVSLVGKITLLSSFNSCLLFHRHEICARFFLTSGHQTGCVPLLLTNPPLTQQGHM